MKIISHRGNGNIYQSNTKEALLESLKYNYVDGIEFDVRLTKDKKIVIIHDAIIDFVSDGTGIVKYMNYKELLKYNFGNKKYYSKICLLEDLLKNIKTNKIIMIEIKDLTNNYEDIIDNIYNILKKYKLNVYIISFNYKLLNYVKKYNLKCGLLIMYFINNDKLYNNLDFNIVIYDYRNRVDKSKETFIFGKIKGNIEKFNIITDKPYLFNKFSNILPK